MQFTLNKCNKYFNPLLMPVGLVSASGEEYIYRDFSAQIAFPPSSAKPNFL